MILKGSRLGSGESMVLDMLSLRCLGGMTVEKWGEYMGQRLRRGVLARDTYFFKFVYFIYLFLAELGLHCCMRAFSSCGEPGLPFVVVRGPLTAVASLFEEHGLLSAGSVAVAHRLSCSAACGILPDQGSNPCPLHWQADS